MTGGKTTVDETGVMVGIGTASVWGVNWQQSCDGWMIGGGCHSF
jgi:hypothetical protein